MENNNDKRSEISIFAVMVGTKCTFGFLPSSTPVYNKIVSSVSATGGGGGGGEGGGGWSGGVELLLEGGSYQLYK